MKTSAVQQNENRRGMFSSVLKAATVGGMAGYVAKHALPLTSEEMQDIPYRPILNTARKVTNKNIVSKFSNPLERTVAQDTFVKMIEGKNFSHVTEIVDDLVKQGKPEVVKEFKEIVKLADSQSKAVAKEITSGFHKMIKCKRPTAAFVAPAAIVGFVSGAVYNAFKHTNID